MVTVQRWTGRESRALREAMRMSTRSFSGRLGISDRSVTKWESGVTVPRADSQEILDTMLGRASADELARFELFLADEPAEATEAISGGDGKAARMPYARTSVRGEKRRLREQMRAEGLDYRQIATEFARVYKLRPRAAWREAYGWSLQEAAAKINAYRGNTGLDPAGLSGMTAPHLCEHENWPGYGNSPAGRKPSPYLLAVLAGIYGCHVSDLIDLADRKHIPKADLLIIDTYTRPPYPNASSDSEGEDAEGEDEFGTPVSPLQLGARLKAERKARMWSAYKMAEMLRSAAGNPDKIPHISMIARMLRRWENGTHVPSEEYRYLYCKALGMSEDKLFPADESRSAAERNINYPSSSIAALSVPEGASQGEPTKHIDQVRMAFPADVLEAMKRREFLLGVATTAGFSAAGAMTARETIRHDIGSFFATDADEWREIVAEYGESYPTTEPSELLKSLMVDLCGLQAAVQSSSRESEQRELRASGAMLSAFTAQTIANLGNLREARRWWRTARNAADESADTYTVLWIRGREIVRAGYEHRPLDSIIELIDDLEARITERSPNSALPEFLSGKAQALALIGPHVADEAERTLNRLRDSYEALPVSAHADNSIFYWGEEKLRFTESLTYTYLGRYREAGKAQASALALYPADDMRSPAQIELQRALCLIGSGDVLDGVRHAQSVINGLPEMHRIRPVADLGHKVLRAIPAQRRENADVREFNECLSVNFSAAPEITA